MRRLKPVGRRVLPPTLTKPNGTYERRNLAQSAALRVNETTALTKAAYELGEFVMRSSREWARRLWTEIKHFPPA